MEGLLRYGSWGCPASPGSQRHLDTHQSNAIAHRRQVAGQELLDLGEHLAQCGPFDFGVAGFLQTGSQP
jgi:hypothetical protein